MTLFCINLEKGDLISESLNTRQLAKLFKAILWTDFENDVFKMYPELNEPIVRMAYETLRIENRKFLEKLK
jgi:hypothetical protein